MNRHIRIARIQGAKRICELVTLTERIRRISINILTTGANDLCENRKRRRFEMKKKFFLLSIMMILSVFLLTGCIPGDGSYTDANTAGFFSGIWHGWIAPVSLIIGIFKVNIRIYESMNSGWWYDFGYYMAIISGFGGLSLARRRSNKKRDD